MSAGQFLDQLQAQYDLLGVVCLMLREGDIDRALVTLDVLRASLKKAIDTAPVV
jgi:hypothetical protein